MALLWVIESFEPKERVLFAFTVKAKDPAVVRPKVEDLLGRHRLEYELRSASTEELRYDVRLPFDKKTDKLSESLLAIGKDAIQGVEWEQKKEKN